MLLLIVFMTGCEEVVHRPIQSASSLLVVEGMLTNELAQHKVKLSWSVTDPDDTGAAVSGAIVTITEGALTYPLTESQLVPGEYRTPTMRAVVGRRYTLHIQYSGEDYFAQDGPLPVEPMSPIGYRAVTNGYVINFEKSGDDPNYIRHDITWKDTPACQSNACEGLLFFYDLKTIDVNEGTKPQQEEFVFPAGSTVARKKYSVSPEYRHFLRAMLSETEWHGGVFDVDRANAPTNLTNGAIGFFAVCTVITDSTQVP